MQLKKKDMQSYRQKTEPLYPVPKRVQELIPVYRIAKDGVFQIERTGEDGQALFDKAYLFSDTNFTPMDDREKGEFLKQYCSALNSLNVPFKLLVLNQNRDMDRVRRELFLRAEPEYGELYQSFQMHVEAAMQKGRSGIEQCRIFVLSCRRVDVEAARSFFRSIEASLAVSFRQMGSVLIPLDAQARLYYLHAFYRQGKEERYAFDFDRAVKTGADWKDFIAPFYVRHCQNEQGALDGQTLEMAGAYVRAYYLPQLPNAVDPELIARLMAGSWHAILTLDSIPVPQNVARKRLMNLYLQNGRAIEKQQEARNKAKAWSSDITYERRREREELESYLDILNDNDEKLYYLGVYAILSANSKEQLEHDATAFLSTAEGEGVSFSVAKWEQIEAVNTALPTGTRAIAQMQPVFTQPLAAFTPFHVHELYEPGGLFYGVNQLSKNVLIGDRKKLRNGNGFVLGVTGGGKGMDIKQELMQVYLNTKDDILVIDPQNEYQVIAEYLKETFIDFGAEAGHTVNPLDTDTLSYFPNVKAYITDKTELVLGIFSQILDREITAQDKSLIGRCVNEIYAKLQSRKKMEQPPTLSDLYRTMGEQPEPQARQLQLALELFVTGSLDLFNGQTHIQRQKKKDRLTVYGIAGLGQEQAAIGMLIMLEGIRARIASNARKGKATWLYIDEFHNLASQEFSARYLEKIWKEVRKLGGLCTGATQNLADLLQSKVVETMLCNSAYLSLLNQSDIELELLHRTLGISDTLLEYVHNVPPGCGLLKFGDKYIPKDNRLDKESKLYQLFNTNFHEKVEEKRR